MVLFRNLIIFLSNRNSSLRTENTLVLNKSSSLNSVMGVQNSCMSMRGGRAWSELWVLVDHTPGAYTSSIICILISWAEYFLDIRLLPDELAGMGEQCHSHDGPISTPHSPHALVLCVSLKI